MKKLTLLIAAALAFGSVAIGTPPQSTASATRTVHSTPHQTSTTAHTTASLLKPASLKLQAPAVFDAKFVTTKGDFVIQVTRDWSPRGADRFYNLVKYHYFDGTAFFRIVQGFVAQFGISPRPEITRAWEDARIPDDPVRQSNTRGTVTYATAGPNTRTTQIFINLGDNGSLDERGFSPFGKVISGMEVVDRLYADYGDGPPDGQGPEQKRIEREGHVYLEKSFPLLDTIKTTAVISAVNPTPAVPAKATAGTAK
jgi:peptidyl-prolyl cis-trans isomerase A (cyclophilin A)